MDLYEGTLDPEHRVSTFSGYFLTGSHPTWPQLLASLVFSMFYLDKFKLGNKMDPQFHFGIEKPPSTLPDVLIT